MRCQRRLALLVLLLPTLAAAVIKAVESTRHEQYVPSSFRPAVVIRHLIPPIFRVGSRKSFAKELAADRRLR